MHRDNVRYSTDTLSDWLSHRVSQYDEALIATGSGGGADNVLLKKLGHAEKLRLSFMETGRATRLEVGGR